MALPLLFPSVSLWSLCSPVCLCFSLSLCVCVCVCWRGSSRLLVHTCLPSVSRSWLLCACDSVYSSSCVLTWTYCFLCFQDHRSPGSLPAIRLFMPSLHYTILALIFLSPTVFGDRRQKPQIGGKSLCVNCQRHDLRDAPMVKYLDLSASPNPVVWN